MKGLKIIGLLLLAFLPLAYFLYFEYNNNPKDFQIAVGILFSELFIPAIASISLMIILAIISKVVKSLNKK